MRLRNATGAVAAAIATSFLFDLGFSLARGTVFHPGYVAVNALLMLAAGAVCVAAGAALPWSTGDRLALALFAIAHGVLDTSALGVRITWAAALGAVTWVFLGTGGSRSMGPVRAGILVSAALCVALALWRYVEIVTGPPLLGPWQTVIEQIGAFWAVLALALCWEFIRNRIPALPSAASTALVLLALGLWGTAVVVSRIRPEQTAPVNAGVAEADRSAQSVFVIVLDTVRADHLSTYGYARDTTPNLARLLSENPAAIQYDLAFSTASWTIPAHASLLTGTMPSVHGAIRYSVTDNLTLLSERTLAEVMRDAGYCTIAVVANPFLFRVAGIQRGFDAFLRPEATRPFILLGERMRLRLFPAVFAGRIRPQPLAEQINELALATHRECGSRPAFVLLNYMDAHSPYLAPPPHGGLFAGDVPQVPLTDPVLSDSQPLLELKRARYDEELHYLDAQLQNLFAALEAEGDLQRSWLFITSDHGESFGEHDSTSHGSSLYNEQVHIPLIVKPPAGVQLPATREPVSLLDITTTVAAIAGREQFGLGHDLRHALEPGRSVQAEFRGTFRTNVKEFGDAADDPARAVVQGRWKLIERGGHYELYDLAADPREAADQRSQDGDVIRSLAGDLPPLRTLHAAPFRDGTSRVLGPDDREALEALGYIR